MTSRDKFEYRTTVEDEHWRNEELQWVRILSSGEPAKGMVLLYIQKACTAFHEFDPAWKKDALDERQVDFFRERLAKRIKQVLITMGNNRLDTINGAAELADILRSIEAAKTMEEIAQLTEKLHSVNHLLLDSLEEK